MDDQRNEIEWLHWQLNLEKSLVSAEVSAEVPTDPVSILLLSKLMSWFTRGVTSGLNGLYITRFENQRTQYWQTLYSSVVQVLGADVALMKWNASPHLGHYRHHPAPYTTTVTNLLEKATSDSPAVSMARRLTHC
ncbi:hypothetical protein LINPERHAP2_LOCUS19185 [Linum perenne]